MRWIYMITVGALASSMITLGCQMENPAFGDPITGTGGASDTDDAGTSAGPGSDGSSPSGGESNSGTTGVGTTTGAATGDAGTDPGTSTGAAGTTTGGIMTSANATVDSEGVECPEGPCVQNSLAECVDIYSYEKCVEGCRETVDCGDMICHHGFEEGAYCGEIEMCAPWRNQYLEHFNPPSDGYTSGCMTDDDCELATLGCNFGAIGCPALNGEGQDAYDMITEGWFEAGCFLQDCPLCAELTAKCMKEDPQLPGWCISQ